MTVLSHRYAGAAAPDEIIFENSMPWPTAFPVIQQRTVAVGRVVLIAGVSLIILVTQPISAQSEVGSPPYLLRLLRMRGDSDVCALVRADGHFHVEKLHDYVARVFEGSIPQADLAWLQEHLSSDNVSKLSQEQIKSPLLTTEERDELLVSIQRAGGWQNLVFPTAESREAHSETLDPFLKLLEDLQKTPHTELSEDEGRSNCLPPAKIELKTRPPAPARATNPGVAGGSVNTEEAAVAGQPAAGLNGIASNNGDVRGKGVALFVGLTTFDEGMLSTNCFVIYTTGHFRHESKSQKAGSKNVAALIREGSLGPLEMAQFATILNELALKNTVPEEFPTKIPTRQFEFAKLLVPRGNRVQNIVLWRYTAAYSRPMGGMPEFHDSGMKLLRPLRKWLKVNIEGKSATALPETSANECKLQP